MGCINVREGTARVILYALDGCGNLDDGNAEGKLVLDTVAEVSWEDQITDGDEVTERNFGGSKKYTSVGADEITSVNVDLTLLGMNPAVDAMLMNGTNKTRSGDVVGFGRNDLSSSSSVAVEILLELDADACSDAATGDPPIASWLFPYVKNWKPSGGLTLNGSDLVKPPYTGKCFKNPNLTPTDVVDDDMVKWNGIYTAPASFADTTTGEWYTFYLFDQNTEYVTGLPAADCEPQLLT